MTIIIHFLADAEGRLCFRSTITVGHIQEELSDENEDGLDTDVGEYSEGMKMGTDPETGSQYVQCSPQTLHCYALWKEDTLGNGTVIIGQGKYILPSNINYYSYNDVNILNIK